MVQKTIKEILDNKIRQTGNKRTVKYIPELTTEEYRICLQTLINLSIRYFVYEETTNNTITYYCITDKRQVYNITRLVFLLTKTHTHYNSNTQYNILSNTVKTTDITVLPYTQQLYKKFNTHTNTYIQDSIRKALGEVIL